MHENERTVTPHMRYMGCNSPAKAGTRPLVHNSILMGSAIRRAAHAARKQRPTGAPRRRYRMQPPDGTRRLPVDDDDAVT